MIDLAFVFFVLALMGFFDSMEEKGEHLYRDKCGNNPDAARWISISKFGMWYALILFIVSSMGVSLWSFAAIVVLHICGLEDFLCYFFEPIFQHSNRETRYPVKFLIWRFPTDLHWLGDGEWWERNYLLMKLCGPTVLLAPFLRVVAVSTVGVIVISLIMNWIF